MRSIVKSIINMLPVYRQGERHSLYLQQLIRYNRQLLYYRARECFMKDDVLKLCSEKGDIFFYLPVFPKNYTSMDIVINLDFAEREELDEVRKYISKDSVVADVGANIGNHTLYFSYFLSPAKIYSFEPQKSIFDILRKNCELNGLQDKVELYNCCLGEKEAFADLRDIGMENAGSTSFAISDSPSDYKMITLDSLRLERLDFIKVDVEGYELGVLKGGEDTIKRCRPVIWCEALTKAHKESLRLYLNTFGYSISALNATNYLFLP